MSILLAACLLCISWSSAAFPAEPPHVEVFSPQGEVKQVRQVAVRFSAQMVSFGDPRASDPFDADCPEKGRGRWADVKNWVYDFDRDLPAGVACRFTMKKGLTTLAGAGVTGQQTFSFTTGDPAVIQSFPPEGSEAINEDQVFILVLDAVPDEASVLSNVSCGIGGISERVGVRLVAGDEAKGILSQYQWLKQKPKVLLQCRQKFPSRAPITLVWGKGVATNGGAATTQDQNLNFKVRGPFTAEFRCDRENARSHCIPVLPLRLNFSSEVSWDRAKKIVLRGGSKIYRPEKPGESDGGEEGEEAQGSEEPGYVYSISFKGPFPEKSSFVIELPKEFSDDAGRPLANSASFPLTVRTGAYPPLAKFSSRFGIIELKSDPTLPVTIRNIESPVKSRMLKVEKPAEGVVDKTKQGIMEKAAGLGETAGKLLPDSMKGKSQEFVDGLKGRLHKVRMGGDEQVIEWLRKVASARREKGLLAGVSNVAEFSVPKPGGAAAFEVVGMPLKESGLYVVELESLILGKALLDSQKPMYVPTAALVTNLSAHFKWGRESSLVWVTTLEKGEPVKDAAISVRDCKGKLIWEGRTDSGGIAKISKQLPSEQDLRQCQTPINYEEASEALKGINRGLFVFARAGGDMTFVHSGWSEGIEPWRFNMPSAGEETPFVAHTVLDRSLVRAGDTLHMKHIMRRHGSSGFLSPKRSDLPDTVVIRHSGSEQEYEFRLKWDGRGAAETTWKIPKEAGLGRYTITLQKKKSTRERGKKPGQEEESPRTWESGSFRVEEFRVPLMKALIQPLNTPLINTPKAEMDLLVSYLSGGGAKGAEVKLRSQVQPKFVSFSDYDNFVFSNGEVKEEKVRYSRSDEQEDAQPDQRKKVLSRDLTLDSRGGLRTVIDNLPAVTQPQDILAELEFRDPNGEIQTVSQRIPLWPASLVIGIKPDSWTSSKDDFRFQVAVLDLSGKPLPGKDVKVDLFQRRSFSHRKRLVGGFYAYENTSETKKIGGICEGRTDARGLLFCAAKSPVSGNAILQAYAADAAGNRSVAHRDVWIVGKGEWWFDVENHDRIDLIPEKKKYEPGETAKFQVRMPFREATALVTVEREGIIETYVRKISGRHPVLSVPVKGNYAPNVFVSALLVRGRVSGVQPTAMVDLGKPAYKLGLAEISVGWKAFELKVGVTPERELYKVREKARVKVSVRRADGKMPPKGSEVAIAAVDEGLLELMPNQSWKLLDAMMGRRGYEVQTSTAQMQVVGKRHYGLKAQPHGGGGGRQSTRELFDTLLLWKGTVRLNEKGEADVEIPLNDSLTSFRIVAIATGGQDLFGTGHASIRTSQDLMVLSGVPQVVREGDSFRAGFTVRNASSRKMDIEMKAAVLDPSRRELDTVTRSLAAGESQDIGWDITVPTGVSSLAYEVTASEKGGEGRDTIRVKQKVVEAIPVRTFQATLMQIDRPFELEVERPVDAIPGKGGLHITLRPKIAESLGGVTTYMRQYPFTCMEQKVSRAVSLRDESLWKQIVAELPSYMDSDGLVKFFPLMTYGSDALTSYILSIADEAGWTIPDPVRTNMENGLKGFIEGKVVRYSSLATADLSIRKLAAVEALSRTGIAEAGMLASISIEPNLWPTSAVLDWTNILRRMKDLPDRDRRAKEASQILRSRMNFQGTTLGFSTERSDGLWWLMLSVDVNAVKSILALLDSGEWQADIPRIVRGALGRQHRGAWDLTTANAWGVLAFEKFSKKFEATPVSGVTTAMLDSRTESVDWSKKEKVSGLDFAWPDKKERLAVDHHGSGRPWLMIQGLAAIPLKEPLSTGYRIKKTVVPVEQANAGRWTRGDVVRVRLELESQADMTWVVVSDPVPAGAMILGTGLGRDSQIMTSGEKREGWVWPAFEERSFEAFRAYYEYVPKGTWTVEYTFRLNNSGTFNLPPTRVEAMYAPEMFGEIPNKEVEVGQ
ncbi:MAG: MG2 domain-containing protein [Nitrospiraceae bacterium]|nr:MG2 domain-containing protein [Nitrospiraceae bacterium]